MAMLWRPSRLNNIHGCYKGAFIRQGDPVERRNGPLARALRQEAELYPDGSKGRVTYANILSAVLGTERFIQKYEELAEVVGFPVRYSSPVYEWWTDRDRTC